MCVTLNHSLHPTACMECTPFQPINLGDPEMYTLSVTSQTEISAYGSMLRSIYFIFFVLPVYSYMLQSVLVKHELTTQLKPTTVTGIQKEPLKKKPPLQAVFFNLCLNVNGCFLLPPLLFFRGGRALWSIALVSHREGIPKVSVEPLICVLHCPNSLCLLFSLYLSPSVSLWIPSLSRPVLHNHLFYRFFFSKAPEGFNYVHRQPL